MAFPRMCRLSREHESNSKPRVNSSNSSSLLRRLLSHLRQATIPLQLQLSLLETSLSTSSKLLPQPLVDNVVEPDEALVQVQVWERPQVARVVGRAKSTWMSSETALSSNPYDN